MDTPKYIYNLISFSQGHIDAWDKRSIMEEEYRERVKGMSSDEMWAEWRSKDRPAPDMKLYIGRAYRGSFLNLDDLIKIIESQDGPYGICECYYTYLLIERHQIGDIDSVCWGEEGEIWYKMNEEDRYIRIEKPDCFKQTCNFT